MKKNEEVTIFKDWENEQNPLGKAKLIKFIKKGLPFSFDDKYLFNYEQWKIEWIERYDESYSNGIHKIRYKERPHTKKVKSITKEDIIIDSFLVVNGIEIF